MRSADRANRRARLPLQLLTILCGGAIVWAGPGCAGRSGVGKTVPVTGKVYLGDLPLTTGSVSFRPDASKGNNSTLEPSGDIGADGTYQLATQGKPGAPPGWYKVIVAADVPSNPNDPYSMPKSLISPKYADPNTTDLSIQVVESPSPGAYDLKVSKKNVASRGSHMVTRSRRRRSAFTLIEL